MVKSINNRYSQSDSRTSQLRRAQGEKTEIFPILIIFTNELIIVKSTINLSFSRLIDVFLDKTFIFF